MSYTEAKLFLTPKRDTGNSQPYEIEFTVTSDGVIMVDIDERCMTFQLDDFKKMIAVAEVVKDG